MIALTRDDTFTEEEAVCIANAVFEEYGDDEEALNRISGTLSYEDLTGPDGIEGFDEAFDQMVRACDAPG